MELCIIYIYIDFGDFCRKNLEKGTDIGFDKEEIKNTNTEDLLTLRKSIVIYLKSKKLKKRNANFMEVYQRISEELKERKNLSNKEENGFKGFIKVDIAPNSILSTSNALSSFSKDEIPEQQFLKRKISMTIEVDIPSFLNDKKQKSEEKSVPSKISIKGNHLDKQSYKNCLTEFGKGLFDEKLDFDHSDNMDSYKVSKKSNYETELREIEIKSAMFNAVPEDLFFSLD